MDPGAPNQEVILDTKWFQFVARRPPGYTQPHYSVQTLDYVHVVAMTPKGELLLVRQFRPAVWETTLELPGGHVELGQTPELAARTELLEETGYEAERFEFLGDCWPDTGRLGNRMWSFFAGNAVTAKIRQPPEPGVDFVIFPGTIRELLAEKSFSNGLNRVALLAAIAEGKLKI
jgi:ADP-ribose pyrophosphatase